MRMRKFFTQCKPHTHTHVQSNILIFNPNDQTPSCKNVFALKVCFLKIPLHINLYLHNYFEKRKDDLRNVFKAKENIYFVISLRRQFKNPVENLKNLMKMFF